MRKHLKRTHPGCPEFAISFFVVEIAKRDWKRATLGQAVGITVQPVMRHLMTDYDMLLLEGVEREAARRRVQPKINAMIGSWSKRFPSRAWPAGEARRACGIYLLNCGINLPTSMLPQHCFVK